MALESEGYEVRTYTDGDEAQRGLMQRPPILRCWTSDAAPERHGAVAKAAAESAYGAHAGDLPDLQG